MPLPIVSHLSVSAELRERLTRKRLNFLGNLVRPAGFEPAAFGSGGQRSIQLSYGRKACVYSDLHGNVLIRRRSDSTKFSTGLRSTLAPAGRHLPRSRRLVYCI